MAKVRNNVMVRGLSGLFGDQMVIKTDKAGRTIVSNKPVFDEDRVFSPAQLAQQKRFREARAYARDARDLEIYRQKAAGTPLTPSNVAMTDWFHPPEIREIDLSPEGDYRSAGFASVARRSRSAWTGQAGQVIRILAVDDVQVKRVSVVITDENEVVLEQGPATAEEGGWWTYTTTAIATGNPKVLVTAEDLPGHIVQMVKKS